MITLELHSRQCVQFKQKLYIFYGIIAYIVHVTNVYKKCPIGFSGQISI